MVVASMCAMAFDGCKKQAADPFPSTNAVAGWQKSGDTRTFDAKNLYQYIDGDAEQYISAGVVTTSTADYKYQGSLEAVVDVHTMSGKNGAHKILQSGTTHEAKTVAIGDGGIAYTQSIVFQKGTYLVRIVAYQSTPDAPQALMSLARGVEARL